VTARYTVTYAPRAQRDLRKLPEKIATACVEFIFAVLAEDPYRVGKPLTSSWEGTYSARRSEWRIIYRIDDHQVLIEVVTIASCRLLPAALIQPGPVPADRNLRPWPVTGPASGTELLVSRIVPPL